MARRLSIGLAALLLAGCGGGHGGTKAAGSRAGGVSLTIAWPARNARYIPTAANYVRVQILQGTNPVAPPVEFTRDASNGNGYSATANPIVLPEGSYRLVAQAYASPSDTNVPLSEGSAEGVAVVAGATTSQKVVMAGTLKGYTVALTDLSTGETIGSYPITPISDLSAIVKARQAVGVTATPMSPAGTMTLYPAGTEAKPLLASGGIALGDNVGSGASIVGSFSPTSVSATGSLTVDFKDLADSSLLYELSASLSITATTPSVATGPSQTFSTYSGTAVASTSDATYYVEDVSGNDGSPHAQISRLGSTGYAQVPSARPTNLAALPSGRVFYSNGSSLYRVGAANPVDTGAAVSSLGTYGGKIYALNVNGNSVTIRRYNDDLSLSGPPTGFTASASNFSGFSIGAGPGGVDAVYAVEGSNVRRYVGGTSAAFLTSGANETITDVATDGNLVWVVVVLTSSSLQHEFRAYLASTGERVATINDPLARVPGIYAGGGRLAAMLPSASSAYVESFTY